MDLSELFHCKQLPAVTGNKVNERLNQNSKVVGSKTNHLWGLLSKIGVIKWQVCTDCAWHCNMCILLYHTDEY